jgi:hypothetical protein
MKQPMVLDMRNLSDLITEGFIWGVGIRRPKPENERRAALYITGLLFGTMIGLGRCFYS